MEAYVGIQKRRYGERLVFDLDVPADLLHAAVPALLLQPLVENAILHGLAPSSRRGKVAVRAARRDGAVLLEVKDDGLGLAQASREGIGLSNTRERLRQLYGSEQSFELESAPGQGTTVTITLPWRSVKPSDGPAAQEDPNADRGRRAARAPKDRVAPPAR